jgi:membrane protein implicated in regulation of membrane protease activity
VVAGWNALVAAASGFVVVVGVLVPWLLPLAVVAAVVVLLIRSGRRRAARRSQTPATSAGPDATMDR